MLVYRKWAAATNLTTNGGFETGTTNIGTLGAEAVEISEDFALFGTKSLKITKDGGTGSSIISVTGFTPDPSTAYCISAWVYVPADSTWPNDWTFRWEAHTDFAGATNDYLETVASSVRDTWTRISTKVTFDVDTVGTFRLRVGGSTPPNGAVMYLDGLQIEAGSVVTPYIETDGATATRSKGPVIQSTSGIIIPVGQVS